MKTELKTPYYAPVVLQQVRALLERNLLAGPSVVDNVSQIKSTGQDLETKDFSQSGFNKDWSDETTLP